MNCKCQRFLPFRSQSLGVCRTTVDHYVKFARILQPMAKVQSGDATFSDDFEVIAIVATRDSVIHIFALCNKI